MKKYFRIILMFLMALHFQSCEKEIMTYGGEPGNISGIYFLYSNSFMMSGGTQIYHYQDSMVTSFAKVAAGLSQMTVKLPVWVLGNLSDQDRTFKVKVVAGNAVEGIDYEPLKSEYIIPANQEKTHIPLVLLRTERLKKEKLNLTVELAENENFKLLLPAKINDDGKTEVVTTHIKVIFSEIYTEPQQYAWFGRDYFGPFTVKKFEFINTIMQWSPEDWDNGKVTAGILAYAVRRVQTELQESADRNAPEYDEDHSFMQLAPGYQVDYSKYETE